MTTVLFVIGLAVCIAAKVFEEPLSKWIGRQLEIARLRKKFGRIGKSRNT